MALTVKQVNGDASLLLTFEPILADDAAPSIYQEPFRILLDPWLSGSIHETYSRLSTTNHQQLASIPSLSELPPIDIIVISSPQSDHCHPPTLKELLRAHRKTVVLAEPAAAKRIRSWNNIDISKIVSLPPWEDPRKTGQDAIVRIEIRPQFPGGEPGETTIAYLAGKGGRRNKHPCIGITYRPPPSKLSKLHRIGQTPPATPKSPKPSRTTPAADLSPATIRPVLSLLPTPPSSPSLRSKRSTGSLTPHFRDRAVSLIYAPHGTSYGILEAYATSHLVAEAALPLTVLLHPFDEVLGPRWRPGRSLRSYGVTAGVETASALGTKAWIRTHDGEKHSSGLLGHEPRRRRFSTEYVRRALDRDNNASSSTARLTRPTGALSLGIGEDVTLTSEGIWEPEPMVEEDTQSALGKYGMGEVLAGIAAEPFAQANQRKSGVSHVSKTSHGSKLLHGSRLKTQSAYS